MNPITSTSLHSLERSRPLGRAVALAAISVALLGCATMNASDGLTDVEPGAFPDLRGGARPASPESSSNGEPTLRGLDRRNWSMVVVRTPAGQVEHQPTYFEPVHIANGTARDAGADPTPATVLEGASTGDSLVAEAAVAPFVFVGELLLVPIRAVIDPPWSVRRAPSTPSGGPGLPSGPNSPAKSGDAAVDWRWVGGTP